MPKGIAARRIGPRLQALQRKHLRRREVTVAVLVVNRERLGRFTCDPRRTPRHLQQPAPAVGRVFEATSPPRRERE